MQLKKLSAIISILLVFVIAFSTTAHCAVIDDIGFETESDYIYLANLDSRSPIYTKNADEKCYPASLTKIMTYIIVTEKIKDLEKTMIPIKQSVLDKLLGTGSSLSGLDKYVDEKLSALDLLYCMMVTSGNDASLVLADYISDGKINEFAKLMNAKVEELGLKNTHFTNPHGLHDKKQYTTASDVYIMAKYAITLPKFMEICSTTEYNITSVDIEDAEPLMSTNQLMNENSEYYYQYTKGIKTGTTDEAGFCLASTAVKDGTAYLCVAMHADCYDSEGEWAENGAMKDTKKLYTWAYDNLQLTQIAGEQEPVTEISLNYGNKDSVFLVPEYASYYVLPKSYSPKEIEIVPTSQKTLDAPVQQGEVLGTAIITYKGETIDEINLVASETINKNELAYASQIVQNVLKSTWFLCSIGVIALLFIVYLIFVFTLKKGSKKKNK